MLELFAWCPPAITVGESSQTMATRSMGGRRRTFQTTSAFCVSFSPTPFLRFSMPPNEGHHRLVESRPRTGLSEPKCPVDRDAMPRSLRSGCSQNTVRYLLDSCLNLIFCVSLRRPRLQSPRRSPGSKWPRLSFNSTDRLAPASHPIPPLDGAQAPAVYASPAATPAALSQLDAHRPPPAICPAKHGTPSPTSLPLARPLHAAPTFAEAHAASTGCLNASQAIVVAARGCRVGFVRRLAANAPWAHATNHVTRQRGPRGACVGTDANANALPSLPIGPRTRGRSIKSPRPSVFSPPV
ncbi:hypothetical protein GY45DRAFT_579186 [Cubamyces sp. BRFM 1775]|nr:hypothetical protein GY45DRAFT_579186 [Cubamyces sp. BRFM 1775]